MFMSIGPDKYQPGAPAALPGKTLSENDQKSNAKISNIDRENLGPPVVAPSFYRCSDYVVNNSNDTNKRHHPSRLKELLDDKYNYDYNINSQIKIRARKQGYNKESFQSQEVAMIANCPPMYTDGYEAMQK